MRAEREAALALSSSILVSAFQGSKSLRDSGAATQPRRNAGAHKRSAGALISSGSVRCVDQEAAHDAELQQLRQSATGLREQVRQFELARVDESVWKERENELRRAVEIAATQKQQVEQAADNVRQQLHEALGSLDSLRLELDSAVGHKEELQRRLDSFDAAETSAPAAATMSLRESEAPMRSFEAPKESVLLLTCKSAATHEMSTAIEQLQQQLLQTQYELAESKQLDCRLRAPVEEQQIENTRLIEDGICAQKRVDELTQQCALHKSAVEDMREEMTYLEMERDELIAQAASQNDAHHTIDTSASEQSGSEGTGAPSAQTLEVMRKGLPDEVACAVKMLISDLSRLSSDLSDTHAESAAAYQQLQGRLSDTHADAAAARQTLQGREALFGSGLGGIGRVVVECINEAHLVSRALENMQQAYWQHEVGLNHATAAVQLNEEKERASAVQASGASELSQQVHALQLKVDCLTVDMAVEIEKCAAAGVRERAAVEATDEMSLETIGHKNMLHDISMSLNDMTHYMSLAITVPDASGGHDSVLARLQLVKTEVYALVQRETDAQRRVNMLQDEAAREDEAGVAVGLVTKGSSSEWERTVSGRTTGGRPWSGQSSGRPSSGMLSSAQTPQLGDRGSGTGSTSPSVDFNMSPSVQFNLQEPPAQSMRPWNATNTRPSSASMLRPPAGRRPVRPASAHHVGAASSRTQHTVSGRTQMENISQHRRGVVGAEAEDALQNHTQDDARDDDARDDDAASQEQVRNIYNSYSDSRTVPDDHDDESDTRVDPSPLNPLPERLLEVSGNLMGGDDDAESESGRSSSMENMTDSDTNRREGHIPSTTPPLHNHPTALKSESDASGGSRSETPVLLPPGIVETVTTRHASCSGDVAAQTPTLEEFPGKSVAGSNLEGSTSARVATRVAPALLSKSSASPLGGRGLPALGFEGRGGGLPALQGIPKLQIGKLALDKTRGGEEGLGVAVTPRGERAEMMVERREGVLASPRVDRPERPSAPAYGRGGRHAVLGVATKGDSPRGLPSQLSPQLSARGNPSESTPGKERKTVTPMHSSSGSHGFPAKSPSPGSEGLVSDVTVSASEIEGIEADEDGGYEHDEDFVQEDPSGDVDDFENAIDEAIFVSRDRDTGHGAARVSDVSGGPI